MASCARPSFTRAVHHDALRRAAAAERGLRRRAGLRLPRPRRPRPRTRVPVHLWIEDDGGTVVAYLRLLDDGDVRRIGRVVTAATHRRRAWPAGWSRPRWPRPSGPVVLHAQSYLSGVVRGVRLQRRRPGVPRRRHPPRPDAPRPLTPRRSRAAQAGLLPVRPRQFEIGDVVELVGELLDRPPGGGWGRARTGGSEAL